MLKRWFLQKLSLDFHRILSALDLVLSGQCFSLIFFFLFLLHFDCVDQDSFSNTEALPLPDSKQVNS